MGKSKKQKHNTSQSIDESHYEGLMSSMRHARNRLLFFILFGTYSLLSILGTTDKMLFMESPVKMPLLNIELPLLAFYSVMPLFLLALHFNLLYTFRSYRDFLLATKKQHPKALDSLPIGLYEGALLKQDSFHSSIRFAMRLLLYILPVLVLTAFWFRFADYQSPAITVWHFVTILISMLLGFYFRGLLHWQEKPKWLGKSILGVLSLLFLGVISSYAYFVIYPITRNTVDLTQLGDLRKIEEKLDNSKLGDFLKREEWFLPRITIRGEVLVPMNKEQLEILQEVKAGKKDQALLLSIPAQNRQKRHFRLAILSNCILPNTNFRESEFQMADLVKTQLQGADLGEAQLQGANLSNAQLQEANLKLAQLQRASLKLTQLQGADLRQAQLQVANLESAQLQGANLRDERLLGANLRDERLLGADLRLMQLQIALGTLESNFSSRKNKQTDLPKIDTEILMQKDANQIIADLQKIKERRYINIEAIKTRLQKAIGKDPIEYIKNQKGINLGVLTEEEFNKIAKEVTNPKARKNMGLPPLKKQ